MADDYKDTLNLPQTEFPMRANLPQREPDMLARWEAMALYQQIIEARKDAPRFTLHDGPPYANGHIHHGHVLNKILKDIVVKYHQLSGHLSEYVPGWDCHGLPIEHEVDKTLGPKKAELNQVQIRQECRDYANRFVDIQRQEFKRLGVLGDWDKPYTTLDFYYEATVLRELGRLIERGLVYKDLKPVHWSYAAKSALAEAEVEYREFKSPSVYVKFPFPGAGNTGRVPAEIDQFLGGRPLSVVIWTTTPWTLPANKAIALHPAYTYAVCAIGDEAIIVADELRPSIAQACGINLNDDVVLGRFEGRQLVVGRPREERLTRHPFLPQDSVLLPADYVTLEQGTGCVHTAPGHGEEDYGLGKEFADWLAPPVVFSPVDDGGRYTQDVPDYKGMHVFEANPLIVKRLHEAGALLNPPNQTVLIERYPHDWRTKQPVIFRATPQWFVRVDVANPEGGEGKSLRQRALEAVDKTRWVPTWGEDRIRGMLEHRPDWCISRQRVWGVPIPALYCQRCSEIVLRHEIAYHVADMAEVEGCDVWFSKPAAELVPAGVTCKCGAGVDEFRKESDILDVWFESGCSFAAVLERRLGWGPKADLYLEGSDQHRGWFQSSLLVGVGARDAAPFATVLTHGFVVDDQGHKYSKSSKNFEAPEKIINSLGAEILRLWVAAVDYRGDITLSPEILQRMTDAYRKIRNTARFLLGNLGDFDPARHRVAWSALTPIDRWAMDTLAQLLTKLHSAYRNYEHHLVFHSLLDYCTVDLSQNYLDVLKDRMYLELPDDPRRRASQTVMYEVLHHLALASAPVLSFTADEVWASMPKAAGDVPSVHLGLWPDSTPAEWLDEAERGRFGRLFKIRERVLEAIAQRRPKTKGEKQPGQIGSSQEAIVRLTAQGALLDFLRQQEPGLLAELFIVSQVDLAEGAQEGDQPGIEIALSSGQKCPRCWNYRHEFGLGGQYPELCTRCAGVVVVRRQRSGGSAE